MKHQLTIIGAGPAGLRAAEVASAAGCLVSLYDAMPSVGRKFLVAGRGGLNLTNTDPQFKEKYSGTHLPPDLWKNLLALFGPADLQTWAANLGIQTFTVSSGRVYPHEMKSAPLLRRWVKRLRDQGVTIFPRHKWTALHPSPSTSPEKEWTLEFQTPQGTSLVKTHAAVFALGGASWPQTGSDGSWQSFFHGLGIATLPFHPANCGWETTVPLAAAGLPLKNIQAHAGSASAFGELMITDYGFEGGILYSLTPALRTSPLLRLDCKPTFSLTSLISKMPSGNSFHLTQAFERCRIRGAARLLFEHHPDRLQWTSPATFAAAVKSLPFLLTKPRPIAEAISSAGGVSWPGLDDTLMLTKFPGLFVAGEMLDWEAPTGGYLMQGCFSTGSQAGKSAAAWLLS